MTNNNLVQIIANIVASTNSGPWAVEGLTQINTYALFNGNNNLQLPFHVRCNVLSDGSNLYLIGNGGTVSVTSTGTQVIRGSWNNAYTSGAANPAYTYSLRAVRIA
jgi:hypothetical protein